MPPAAAGEDRNEGASESQSTELVKLLLKVFAREVESIKETNNTGPKGAWQDKEIAVVVEAPSSDNDSPQGEPAPSGQEEPIAPQTSSASKRLHAIKRGARHPRPPSSRFRGCTRHRRTKRFEAHIWDQRQQRYLGGFDREDDAGKAHDVMAIKCNSGDPPQLNFPQSSYDDLLPLITSMEKEEIVAALRQLNRSAPAARVLPKAVKVTGKGDDVCSVKAHEGQAIRKKVQTGPSRASKIAKTATMAASLAITEQLGCSLMNQTSFCGYEVPRDAAKQREAKRHVQSAFACRKDDPLPSDDTLIQLTSRPISPFCGSLEGFIFPDAVADLIEPGEPSGQSMACSVAVQGNTARTSLESLRSKQRGPIYMGKTVALTGNCLNEDAVQSLIDSRMSHSMPEPKGGCRQLHRTQSSYEFRTPVPTIGRISDLTDDSYSPSGRSDKTLLSQMPGRVLFPNDYRRPGLCRALSQQNIDTPSPFAICPPVPHVGMPNHEQAEMRDWRPAHMAGWTNGQRRQARETGSRYTHLPQHHSLPQNFTPLNSTDDWHPMHFNESKSLEESSVSQILQLEPPTALYDYEHHASGNATEDLSSFSTSNAGWICKTVQLGERLSEGALTVQNGA